MILAMSIAGVVFALLPALNFLANLPLFQLSDSLDIGSLDGDPLDGNTEEFSVSVLIPARDEEAGIVATIDAVLASCHVNLEVIVLDDHSVDSTASLVQEIAAKDSRVRYEAGDSLPAGWNGKQFACFQLAQFASHEWLVFLDADVRVKPDALAILARRQANSGVELLSAFPHQETGTWLEKLIIPMMHYILLGFLPLSRMRNSTSPAYAAGCGQLFMTRREPYQRAGTHDAIRASRHDGLKLPRAFRQAGMMTDVVDGTDLADCRMYRCGSEVIHGVLKNAVEGIAKPKLIVLFSVLLFGSSVLPIITLVWSLAVGHVVGAVVSVVGVLLGHLPRAIAAKQLRQSWAGVFGHSFATAVFLCLQWIALINQTFGRRVAWRGRIES